MNTRRGRAYYPLLVKEFSSNITEKNNKDLINIRTTVKGIPSSFGRALLYRIASIPNKGSTITDRYLLNVKTMEGNKNGPKTGAKMTKTEPSPVGAMKSRTLATETYHGQEERDFPLRVSNKNLQISCMQCPSHSLCEEEGGDEDDEEGNDDDYEEFDDSLQASIAEM
ncbi:hypothetical protein M9H77_23782 [Catharanthus roseus]|uniref:Uncharacterized protein n=1 Tax=Catharanthus roseus TaxID=4058 RepID=A0ACC0AV93_CATRO|nr:hypothetical protein M9H77_23782 [Catharanthus roseus]